MPKATKTSEETGRKISEALEILKAFGLPREQHNERSALALLALLDLKPADSWSKAAEPLMGITPMIEFFATQYGKRYAPNTRETVRRFTIHQFVQAGLVVANPDQPARPTNSPKAVYQIEPRALKTIRLFGSSRWGIALKKYLSSVETLKGKYARERTMQRIPIVLNQGRKISLSPGGQNILVKKILDDFCPLYTPGGKVTYVGDAEKKWLVLIEAVTSHGPVNLKRRLELRELFRGCSAGLVFVTAFMDRTAMVKYLGEISWETEVWVAESPTHLIHFNGERFLGPYEG